MNVWEKFNATFICMIMIIPLQGPFFPPLFTMVEFVSSFVYAQKLP